MNCKDLNIDLCCNCIGEIDLDGRCNIIQWKDFLLNKKEVNVKFEILKRVSIFPPEDNLYIYETIKNYFPQYLSYLEKCLLLK
jgi:hypothetical protein